MKTIRNLILAVGLVLSIQLLPAQIAPFGISNRDRTPFESAPPDLSDSIVQLTAETQGLQLVPPDQIPFSGTFWTIMPGAGKMALPYPCPPLGVNLPTYSLPGGSYLVDYTASTNAVTQADLTAQATLVVNLIDQAQAITASQSARPMARMMVGGLPMPGGGGTNTYGGDFVTNTLPIYDYGTNLWLAQVNISSNYLTAIASNTFPDVPYEIQSWSDLDQPTNWVSQGFFLGSETTNWTPLNPLPVSLTNNFFIGLRSWADDGSGLPLWWQLQYFGYVGVDPNALDAAGDGYTIYQKFVLGVAPGTFYTPAAPQGLTLDYNGNTGAVILNWLPSPGAVTNYQVQKVDGDTGETTVTNVSASVNSYADNISGDTPYYGWSTEGSSLYVNYSVTAQYALGDSAPANASLEPTTPLASLVAAPLGAAYVAIPALPAGTTALLLTRIDQYNEQYGYDPSDFTNFAIAVSSGTNGLYPIPTGAMTAPADAYGYAGYGWFVQTLNASNGPTSAALFLSHGYFVLNAVSRLVPPCIDGRAALKDNVRFLLQDPSGAEPFALRQGDNVFFSPTNYVCAGLYNCSFSTDDGFNDNPVFDPLVGLENNCLFRNLMFTSADTDPSGSPDTGVYSDYAFIPDDLLCISNTPAYQFDLPDEISGGNNTTFSSLIASGKATGIIPTGGGGFGGELWPWFTVSAETNFYGLPLAAIEFVYETNSDVLWGNYNPGQAVPSTNYTASYQEFQEPVFQTQSYYFAVPGVNPMPEQNLLAAFGYTGVINFATTNETPLIITSVGNPIRIAGYAKMTVLNAYTNRFAYLGQYFGQAYQIDTNASVTTNTTGVLSEYGDFFPTQPGPAALVTMPDIDTGEQGTCTVSVVSLQLSKTPAADMTDTSFNSPDATSPASPMVFWCNNNFDRLAYDSDDNAWYLDDVPSDSHPAWGADGPNPDFNYPNYELLGERSIPNTRDLEDFARLWVCGVTSNLLAALPGDSTVTLSWGSVSAGNPAIDLFIAADADGGIGYLTNSTTATQQVNTAQCPFIGRIAPGGSIRLNASTFAGNWAGNHFIWCGVSNGTGGLTLTIADGSGNVLAQTTAYIQIQDIKQMYERWTVGDNISVAPTNNAILATEGLLPPTPAFQYPQPTVTNTPYILFVHGWNMTSEEKDRFAETAYKRLYWQGYQGRFGSFRWPTGNGFTGWTSILTDPDNFDNSEFNAWQSGAGLLNKLKDLNSIYPGNVYLMAHSMGNVVAGEALRLAGTQVVNTYVAMQAAVASQAYDPTTPTRSLGILDSGTPNRYAQYYASGAPCYFNGSSGAGTYVNFFNTNDFALGKWQVDQNLKPDSGYSWTYEGPTNTEFYTYTSPFLQTRNLYFPTNTYEIFSHGDEARCYALGAQPNVGGAFESGLVLQQVELDIPPFNFQQQHVYHSYEFRVDYPPNVGFWNNLLISMKLK